MRSPKAIVQQGLKGLNSRFVLLIGDDGAILVYVEKGLVIRRLFAPSPDRQHTKSFVELMEEYPQAAVHVLIDVMDQSYVRHTFPPVTSLGLSKIVQRRLERDFAKEDIKGALNLGRESKGRKDWNFLLISLANTKELQSWLELVMDLPNRFAGIYLVPVECENIIASLDQAFQATGGLLPESSALDTTPDPAPEPKKRFSLKRAKSEKSLDEPKTPKVKKLSRKEKAALAGPARWQIMVSHNKVGGYRQAVLREGKLVFTRMTQASDGTPELQAGNVEQEVQNTIEYLKRLGYNDSSPLDIYIIVAQEVKNNISRERFGQKDLHLLTPYEAAELLRLKQAVLSGDRFGDMVIATSFGLAKKHRLKLNSPYGQRLDKLYKAGFGLRVAAAAILVGMLGYMLYDLALLPGTLVKNSDLEAEQQKRQRSLASFQQTVTNLHIDPDQVNDLVALHGLLTAPSPLPLAMIGRMQTLIDDDHLLKGFTWKTPAPAGPMFLDKAAAAASATASPPTPGAPTEVGATTATWTMDVAYHNGVWDDFVKQTNLYYDTVAKSFADYKVEHTALPGQTQSSDNLTVNFEEQEQREKSAKEGQNFEITVTLNGPLKKAPATPPSAGVAPTGAMP